MTASKTVTRAHLKAPSAAAIAGLVVSCLLIAAFWLLRIGKELTDHRRFTLATNIDVYFCDPQNPWQRGSNENTNRLLRQSFPKGTDMSVHSQTYLNKVARQLNERPRKSRSEKFKFMTRGLRQAA